MSKFVSIVITHFHFTDVRSVTMKRSLGSLIENTKYPYELIIVDNGGSEEDSEFLQSLKPNVYIRNELNMHFGYARNQGIALSRGDYVCIADNDIIYKKGWLTECVKVLEAFPEEKIYATPIDYPTRVMKEKYHQGQLKLNENTYNLSMRAGSNCFVIRKEDLNTIGWFAPHRIAGSLWTDNAVHAGYLAAVVPGEMVFDEGLRAGYNLGESIPIKLRIRNFEDIYFNVDEFRRDHPNLLYVESNSSV